MKSASVYMGRFALCLVGLAFAMWVFGPYEPVEYSTDFDENLLAGGVTPYLAAQEARFDDIKPGSAKRVIWAGADGEKTPYAVVYFHGFSANAQEIRPVPDKVADALGANLVFTRFQGHGRDGDAMAEATVAGWMADAAEALAVARHVGDRVIVMTTSTGGTIAALALHAPELQKDVAGVVFVAPNFGVNNPAAGLLTLPAVRFWGPVVAGAEQSFEPLNDGQAAEWTTRYPTVATLPMAASVQEAVDRDYSDVRIPALFHYADDDQVVIAAATDRIVSNWGGPVTVVRPEPGDNDDPMRHVIAGDIMSPGQTDRSVAAILDWAGGLQ